MRKRFAILLAANGRWPDAQTGSIGFPFNWVKIDNKGSASVDVGFSGNPSAGDKIDTYMTVSNGKVRVFNVAGPRVDGKPCDDWPTELHLVSASGTTVVVEVADDPIVDVTFAT